MTGHEPLPHNIEVEQALLGAVLVNNDALHQVSNLLEPAHFFEPIHQQIYETSRTLIRSGKLATPITLRSYLPATLDIAGLSLGKYLARLTANATTIINAPDFAREVLLLSGRRQIIAVADDLRNMAIEGSLGDSAADIASFGIDRLNEVATAGRVNHTPQVSIGEAADEAIERMTAAKARDGKIGGITWGLRSLDEKTDGLHRGELVIVAGRPGMGKTGLVVSSALGTATAGHNVIFFSLEMTGASLGNRCIADLAFDPHAQSPIAYWNISNGRLSNSDMETVAEAARDLRDLPITIDQQPALSVSQIAARSRKHKANLERRGKSLDAVYVDHMGLVQATDRYRGHRTAEVTEISGGLKAMAKDLNVPVVALAQLNRGVEGRDEKRPGMSDLRDSGAIEQDADLIIFLYREEYYLGRSQSKNPADEDRRIARLAETRNRLELIVAKQRNGPVGVVEIIFNCASNAARDLS